jgi:hypothetical protein
MFGVGNSPLRRTSLGVTGCGAADLESFCQLRRDLEKELERWPGNDEAGHIPAAAITLLPTPTPTSPTTIPIPHQMSTLRGAAMPNSPLITASNLPFLSESPTRGLEKELGTTPDPKDADGALSKKTTTFS